MVPPVVVGVEIYNYPIIKTFGSPTHKVKLEVHQFALREFDEFADRFETIESSVGERLQE